MITYLDVEPIEFYKLNFEFSGSRDMIIQEMEETVQHLKSLNGSEFEMMANEVKKPLTTPLG